MPCPFCQSPVADAARACRVCGGPLRAPKPKILPIPLVAINPKPFELARQTFAENSAPLVTVGVGADENAAIVLVRENGVVQIWDAQSGELSSFSIGRWLRKSSPIYCAALAPNFIATGHQNGEVRLRTLDGRERKSPASHLGRVLALAVNATHFYSGGSDGVIWATSLATKPQSRALIEGMGGLTTFAVAPDETLIAVGCDDGAVQLWRANAEQTAAKLDWRRREHEAPIGSLAFSANGHMLVSRDKDGKLCLWAAQTSYQLPLAPPISAVAPAFSGDNRWLAVSNTRGGVEVFDVALGTLFCELPPLDEGITHLAFATEAALLVVARAREVTVWKFL